jgi:EF-hand domain pair/EF hand
MKKFLIAATVLLAGTASLAQRAPVAQPAPAAPPAPMAHPMADKVMTRAEMVQKVREHFGQLDNDHDGVVSVAEAAEMKHPGGAWQGEHGTHMMGGDPNAAFDRIDTNKNGSISRDEFAKAHEQRMERRVEIREQRKEGAKDGKQVRKQVMSMHGPGGFGGHMIAMADTNKDGKVTLPEAEALALQHFDQMDANHDGQVTPEERRAARPMMMKQMREEKKTAS